MIVHNRDSQMGNISQESDTHILSADNFTCTAVNVFDSHFTTDGLAKPVSLTDLEGIGRLAFREIEIALHGHLNRWMEPTRRLDWMESNMRRLSDDVL